MINWYINLTYPLQALVASMFTWAITSMGSAVVFLFTSFVNMYVWNNVLIYFFDLKRISLLGGFGIGVVLSVITTDIPGSGNADDRSSIYYLFLSRGLILLFAWLFTLFT